MLWAAPQKFASMQRKEIMSTTTSIHVAIVEDDRSLREGLGVPSHATPGSRLRTLPTDRRL